MILDPMWDCGLLTRGLLNFNCSYERDRQNNRERLWFIFLQEIKLNSTQVMDKSKQPRRKRARLHFSEKKNRVRLEETGLHAWLRSSNMSFVSRLSQTWSVPVPAVWLLHLPSTNQRRGDALHTQTHMQTQSQAPLNCPAHTCSCKPQYLHTHSLECSKEIRAAGQGGVRPASSANPLFLHLSRSPGIITHILDIALQFPPWREKRKGCLLLYAVGIFKWTPARSNCGTLWPGGEFRYRQTPV